MTNDSHRVPGLDVVYDMSLKSSNSCHLTRKATFCQKPDSKLFEATMFTESTSPGIHGKAQAQIEIKNQSLFESWILTFCYVTFFPFIFVMDLTLFVLMCLSEILERI